VLSNAPKFPWFALYVKSRHEKAIANALINKGYTSFLPLYKPGKNRTEVPLFPNYLFSRIDVRNRLPVLTVPGVFFIVGNAEPGAGIDEREIEAVRTIVQSGCYLEPCAFLQAGDRVRIDAGPLRGAEGILRDSDGVGTLVVSVSLLQRSVAVRMDRSWVRPAPPAGPVEVAA
jgi:transcription antitermination factor NusG